MKTSPQYTTLKQRLLNTPYTWTVTGAAGGNTRCDIPDPERGFEYGCVGCCE